MKIKKATLKGNPTSRSSCFQVNFTFNSETFSKNKDVLAYNPNNPTNIRAIETRLG